jgi:phosphatidylglycerol lysyltransferase
MIRHLSSPPKTHFALQAAWLGLALILNGLVFVFLDFGSRIHFHGHELIPVIKAGPTVFSGVTLLYIGMLIRRRKRTAWLTALAFYAFWAVIYLIVAIVFWGKHHQLIDSPFVTFVNILVPTAIIALLWVYRRVFTVRSDIRNFAIALRISALTLGVAFMYGVAGFMLMDVHDYRQKISLGQAAFRTVNQLGIGSAAQLTPYTGRAHLFERSLSVLSIGAIAYSFVSLFQPLRARFSDQTEARQKAATLLERYPATSEDFFKLWPHDKVYFFDQSNTAGLAYAVQRGVALVVGDPLGNAKKFDALLEEFEELCHTNDWQIAFIHTEPQHNDWYRAHGFSLQKIGEEAVVDLAHFSEHVQRNKYFRHIRNRFEKQGYSTELLQPPFTAQDVERLRIISDEWLGLPGREERGFVLGYYSTAYMLQSEAIMVLLDADGIIQAFINQIPSYDTAEINFDLLRYTQKGLGNSNDYLLVNFLASAKEHGFARANLGLCPLSGLGNHDESHALIDNALSFVYNKGDRFYSFTGLRRFKAKYEPDWSPRYIAYREGVTGFTRVVGALNRAMKL